MLALCLVLCFYIKWSEPIGKKLNSQLKLALPQNNKTLKTLSVNQIGMNIEKTVLLSKNDITENSFEKILQVLIYY